MTADHQITAAARIADLCGPRDDGLGEWVAPEDLPAPVQEWAGEAGAVIVAIDPRCKTYEREDGARMPYGLDATEGAALTVWDAGTEPV